MTKDWKAKAECAKVVEAKPYMQGAWDGPNDEGVEHPYADDADLICRQKCPVRAMCVQDALDDEESQGKRGGFDFDAGRVPVGDAREIRDTLKLRISSRQSMGRMRK